MNAERLSEVRQYAIQAIKEETESTLKLIDQLDDNFDRAVELMFRCNGKVIVTGVGKSGHIGAKIAATLSSTGTPAFFVNPLDAYHGDLGVIGKEDVVLALSNSGQTDELLRFIPIVLHMNIPIIGISANPASLLAKYSTIHIKVRVEKEACPLNLAPTSSTTAALVMGDASLEDGKIVGLITDGDIRRAMEKWQARFFDHIVSDIMTKEPKTVLPDTKITEIQCIMQQHKIHTVLVCDQQKRLLGIVDHYSCML